MSSKIKTAHARARSRIDGWENILTNLGKNNKDKRTGMRAVEFYLNEQQVDSIYQADDMAAKIIDRLPDDMTREGFTVKLDGGEDITSDIEDIFEKMDLHTKIALGLKWARQYGGAGAIMGINDGKLPWEPVEFNKIRSIDYSTILNRYSLPSDGGSDNIDANVQSKNFGLPVFYRLNNNSNIQIGDKKFTKIHHSRIIRFNGVKLGDRQMAMVDYWGDSIFSRLFNVLRNFQGAHDSAATIITDFTQLIVKLKNLADMIASGDDTLVQERLALMSATASIVNAVVIEEGEDVERKTTNVAGLPDLLGKINARFVAATEYPHTILLGEGATGGLGTQGQSEKRDYYDTVKNKQEDILRPIHTQFLNLIFLAKNGPTGGKLPKYSITYKPLWQPTNKEIVEERKIQAEIDEIYSNIQVLDAQEIADSRFGGGGYSIETTMNSKLRAQITDLPENPDDVEEK